MKSYNKLSHRFFKLLEQLKIQEGLRIQNRWYFTRRKGYVQGGKIKNNKARVDLR